MGNLKNKALKNDDKTKKFTLKASEIEALKEYRAIAQQALDQTLQTLTSVFLHHIAVDRLGYSQETELSFALDLESKQDNITISVLK